MLIEGGIKSGKQALCLIVVNDRLREADKLGMATEEVCLAVIGAGAGGAAANRTFPTVNQLRLLAGPAALGALDPGTDALEKFADGDFQRDDGIDTELAVREPGIEKKRLRETAREAVEHPAARLEREPVGEDGTHQIVRQIFAASEDGHGFFPKLGALFHMLAEHGTGAEIA
jgi:hypothetical protein